jgi:transposase
MVSAEPSLVDQVAHCQNALQKLRAENQRLRAKNPLGAENLQLRAENEQLRARVAELEKALGKAERSGKRQAAPFSRNKPKKERKKNGRKAGAEHGPHAHRPGPTPTEIDEVHQAPLPDACPHCGHDQFDDLPTVEQYQEDLPLEPIRRKIVIHKGTCRKCGQRVQGRHRLQTNDAVGACAAQIGPVAQAAVVYLNKHAGMSYAKISDSFAKLHGMKISRGACCQIVLRAADKLTPAHDEINEQIKASKHITPDETGWREGGQPAWLHCRVGDNGAVSFTISPSRGAEVLETIIGPDWSGTMTHDGYSAYDGFEEAIHQQCVDHAIRRARKLVEKYPQDVVFPTRVIELFRAALKVRDRRLAEEIDDAELYRGHEHHVAELLKLTDQEFENEEYGRFARHLYKHGEQWFMFLIDATVPATNHRGEQALKTPIVNRKVFGGNQTPAGSRAQETTSSVLATCKNRAINFVGYVAESLCGCVANLFV